MKILTFSSLYPNNVDPGHGIFVERRLLELVTRTDVEATVVAPVPWFPSQWPVFGRYGDMAGVSKSGTRHGIQIRYPRYPAIPKVGMSIGPYLMARALRKTIATVLEGSSIALIDAHYFYPDGVAAALLAKRFGLPCFITARGSDINLISRYRVPRRQILWAAGQASAIIAVSDPLGESLKDMGVAPQKLHVLPNGVDLDFFSPGDRDAAKQAVGVSSRLIVSVGALKPAKGHDIVIRSLAHMPDTRLTIIGDGPDRKRLEALVRRSALGPRVEFVGRLDETRLRTYYRAADALLLMSRREGMPNVVLESLACGTPVVASDVGGIPGVLSSPAVGRVLSSRDPDAVARACTSLLDKGVDRAIVRCHAGQFSWNETIDRLYSLLRQHNKASGAQPVTTVS